MNNKCTTNLLTFLSLYVSFLFKVGENCGHNLKFQLLFYFDAKGNVLTFPLIA